MKNNLYNQIGDVPTAPNDPLIFENGAIVPLAGECVLSYSASEESRKPFRHRHKRNVLLPRCDPTAVAGWA